MKGSQSPITRSLSWETWAGESAITLVGSPAVSLTLAEEGVKALNSDHLVDLSLRNRLLVTSRQLTIAAVDWSAVLVSYYWRTHHYLTLCGVLMLLYQSSQWLAQMSLTATSTWGCRYCFLLNSMYSGLSLLTGVSGACDYFSLVDDRPWSPSQIRWCSRRESIVCKNFAVSTYLVVKAGNVVAYSKEQSTYACGFEESISGTGRVKHSLAYSIIALKYLVVKTVCLLNRLRGLFSV